MLTPELRKINDSIDYSRFIPMGRARAMTGAVYRKALNPELLAKAHRAFEQEAAQFQRARVMNYIRKQAIEQVNKRRADAARAFRSNWPSGSSENLVNRFITNNPLFNPRMK